MADAIARAAVWCVALAVLLVLFVWFGPHDVDVKEF